MSGEFLVIGGTGRTGRRVASLLAERGEPVVIGSRNPRGQGQVLADLARGVDHYLVADARGIVVSVEPPADEAGADAVLGSGVARLAEQVTAPIVLISQIYITRAAEHPDMAAIIRARAAGEQALRDSGAAYAIVRPGWLTDASPSGARLDQGDTGDGQVSRDTVASAVVAALLSQGARGKTFEIYDGPRPGAEADWQAAFAALDPDEPR